MSRDSALTLRDFIGKFDTLTFDCSKCVRRGRYHVASLVDRFELDKKMPELLAETSADCPKRSAGSATGME